MHLSKRALFAFIIAGVATAQTAPRPTAPPPPPASQASAPSIGAASRIEPANSEHVFPAGRSLMYDAEWRLWNAGAATVTLESDGTSHKVSASAASIGFAAVLYSVQDRFESHFDARTHCSEHLYKHTEEGSHKRDTNILYDYRQRKAVLDERNLKTNEQKHQTEDIPACVTDVVSGVFYVASLPLLPNGSYTFPLNDGGKTVDVKATVEGKEQVKTPAGSFNTIRVRVEADTGQMKKRGSIWIWYSDDANRIPVQMRARAFWGTLNLKLNRVEQKK